MPRVVDYLLHLARFYDVPEIHDQDVVGDLIRCRQVVRYVEYRNAQFVVQRPQRLKYRRPQGGIDHRHRLICDYHLGLQEQRPRDHNALTLSTAQLMRIATERLGGT